MSSGFYRAFEDEFRGGRELVKSRLAQYLPFINSLKKIESKVSAVDLGCGRGEWLELLDENGISACGVDLDDGMLAACRERNFNVEQGDAIAFLKSLPDESLSIVSAFHFVEHVPFDDLKKLVQESLRVLKPAGLLIMETPNPESLVVGTASFYFDPSHEKPIPPQLLEFLPRHFGFSRTKIIRLQEPRDIETKHLNLFDVFFGVSPDYSVVAQKSAPDSELAIFNFAFEREYGVSLKKLTMKYCEQAEQKEAMNDQRLRIDSLQNDYEVAKVQLMQFAERSGRFEALLEVANEELKVTTEKFQSTDGKLREKNAQVRQMQEELDLLNAQLVSERHESEHWASVANALDSEIKNLYNSRSWRITWPLRKGGVFFRWILFLPKRSIRWLLVKAMALVIKLPLIPEWAGYGLKKFPRVREKLRRLAHARGLIDIYASDTNAVSEDLDESKTSSSLTAHARRVYLELARRAEGGQGGQG